MGTPVLINKTALLGGASQGIGRAIAFELAGQGANIIALARTPASLTRLVEELPCVGGSQQHQGIAVDLGKVETLEAALSGVLSQGGIDMLVINSGGPPGGALLAASAAAYGEAFAHHLFAAIKLVALCVPGMQERGWGRILGVISTSVKSPLPGLGVSNTVRGAMANWLKTLSYELAGGGITVNALLPGFTATARLHQLMEIEAERRQVSTEQLRQEWQATVPCGRFGRPEEIAAAAGFLLSPQAAYINGVCLAVDGGRTRVL